MDAKDSFEVEEHDGIVVIKLAPIMDMATAENFLITLRYWLEKNIHVTLNAIDVQRISTPCVQIICALSKSLEKKSLVFSIQKPSPNIVKAMQDIGLSKEIKKWSKE